MSKCQLELNPVATLFGFLINECSFLLLIHLSAKEMRNVNYKCISSSRNIESICAVEKTEMKIINKSYPSKVEVDYLSFSQQVLKFVLNI